MGKKRGEKGKKRSLRIVILGSSSHSFCIPWIICLNPVCEKRAFDETKQMYHSAGGERERGEGRGKERDGGREGKRGGETERN